MVKEPPINSVNDIELISMNDRTFENIYKYNI